MTNEDAANILRLMASGIELKNHTEHWISSFEKAYEMAIKVLEERPQGEWIEEGTEIGAFGIKYTWNKCNKCGWSSSLVLPKNFCPNCGADMRGNKNESLY